MTSMNEHERGPRILTFPPSRCQGDVKAFAKTLADGSPYDAVNGIAEELMARRKAMLARGATEQEIEAALRPWMFAVYDETIRAASRRSGGAAPRPGSANTST
ncbi:DUF6074 family protein [Rhodoplanes azumiensis]|uniref:DUF6074 family protein n=1 Tax=Rhodoplanes azumiensis TaxID=1897628 RepID=A0ABW5AMD2_9BRAD